MIQLFDYVKIVFSRNEKEWKEIKDIDKSRNFFMLNRFMSIQFPVQASFLCHYKIDAVSVSDYWHRTLSSKFSSTPKWVYAKTVKKKDQEKKLDLPSNEMIRWYCERNEMTRSDFDQNVKFFGDKFLDEIRSMEKILKSQGLLSA
jgi:hypothetical protein